MKWKLAIITVVISLIAGGAWFTAWANTPSTYPKPDKTEILSLVNAERLKTGAKALVQSDDMQTVAQMKADDFVAKGYYAHNIPGINKQYSDEMFAHVDGKCEAISENITNNIINAKHALESWMGSPPHRHAILDERYTSTGIGVSQDVDGDYFVVQQFCR